MHTEGIHTAHIAHTTQIHKQHRKSFLKISRWLVSGGLKYLGLMAAKLASARTPTGAVSSSTSPFILQQIGQVKMPTALHIQDEIPASEDKSSLLFPLLSHLLYYIPLSMIPCHCRLTWRLVIILSEPCTICLSYFVTVWSDRTAIK